MGEEVVKTSVDRLISFLEGKDKAPLLETAKELGVSVDTLQSWVDFLVEEGLLGIEYKFTKPYIYLNRGDKTKARIIGEEELSWDTYHQTFLQKAADKNITDIKAAALWKNHVLQKLEAKKAFFRQEALKRGFKDADALWQQYRTDVLMRI